MSLDIVFPRLVDEGYHETSPATPRYNCIAWAAGDVTGWWWPDAEGQYHWPPGVPREETVAAFVALYGTLGYLPGGAEAEGPGYERVALYAREGRPTHAARQLPNGRWTSKLGPHIDIEHTLSGLEGPAYGAVVQILQRPTPPSQPAASD